MLLTRIVLISACGLAAVASAEPVSPMQRFADEGIQLELTPAGLKLVASVVKDEILGGEQERVLPDVDRELLGIDLHLRGLKLKFQATSVDLLPTDGALALSTGLHAVELSIDSLQFEKTVLGARLQTTCTNTVFHIAEQGIVYLKSTLAAAVRQRAVELTEGDTSFRVNSDNYRVEGPGDCDGLAGTVTGLMLHLAFEAARPGMESMVRSQVRDLLPTVAEQITQQATQSMSFELPDLPGLPQRRLTIGTYPSRIVITPASMKVVIGAAIAGEDTQRALVSRPRAIGPRLGSLGFNPVLLTETMQAIFPGPTPWLEVDESLSPEIPRLLALDSLAILWPDLLDLQADAPVARLMVRLVSAPLFGVDAATNALTAHVPQLEMLFLVKVGGEWRNYFVMKLDVNAGVLPVLADETLSISLSPDSTVGVDGEWAEGYEPANPTFDRETAVFLSGVLINAAVNQGPLISVLLPPIDVLGREFVLNAIGVDGPFLTIGIHEGAR